MQEGGGQGRSVNATCFHRAEELAQGIPREQLQRRVDGRPRHSWS